jgi:enoyl-CoA hydratase/carnithine racemase
VSDEPQLREHHDGGVLRLTLDRPQARNALSHSLIETLDQRLRAADSDDAVRVVVIAGAPGFFSAGADLGELAAETGGVVEALRARLDDPLFALLSTMQSMRTPIICAVRGYALGAALGIVAQSHLVVAARDAQFGFPEAAIGIFPAGMYPYVVARCSNRSRVFEWAVTGRRFSADEAERVGLVTMLAEPDAVDADTDRVAAAIAAVSPLVVEAGLLTATGGPPAGELLQSRMMYAIYSSSADHAEGKAAFREKRQPIWTGT